MLMLLIGLQQTDEVRPEVVGIFYLKLKSYAVTYNTSRYERA